MKLWLAGVRASLRPGGILAFTFLGDRTMQELNRYPRPIPPASEIHFCNRILLEALERLDPNKERYARTSWFSYRTAKTDVWRYLYEP